MIFFNYTCRNELLKWIGWANFQQTKTLVYRRLKISHPFMSYCTDVYLMDKNLWTSTFGKTSVFPHGWLEKWQEVSKIIMSVHELLLTQQMLIISSKNLPSIAVSSDQAHSNQPTDEHFMIWPYCDLAIYGHPQGGQCNRFLRWASTKCQQCVFLPDSIPVGQLYNNITDLEVWNKVHWKSGFEFEMKGNVCN